jgi:hypothetical protein
MESIFRLLVIAVFGGQVYFAMFAPLLTSAFGQGLSQLEVKFVCLLLSAAAFLLIDIGELRACGRYRIHMELHQTHPCLWLREWFDQAETITQLFRPAGKQLSFLTRVAGFSTESRGFA